MPRFRNLNSPYLPSILYTTRKGNVPAGFSFYLSFMLRSMTAWANSAHIPDVSFRWMMYYPGRKHLIHMGTVLAIFMHLLLRIIIEHCMQCFANYSWGKLATRVKTLWSQATFLITIWWDILSYARILSHKVVATSLNLYYKQGKTQRTMRTKVLS